MTSTLTSRRLVSALVAGAASTAYYATPDFVASRTARGWIKTGISVIVLASAVPDFLELRDELRSKKSQEHASVPQGTDDAPSQDESTSISTRGKVALGGVAVAALAASVVPLVLAEKWVYRRGEARAAAGKAFAHTRPALVFGALTTAVALVPSRQDDETASRGIFGGRVADDL